MAKEELHQAVSSAVHHSTSSATAQKAKAKMEAKVKAKDATLVEATILPGTVTLIGAMEKEKGKHTSTGTAGNAASTDMTVQTAGQAR